MFSGPRGSSRAVLLAPEIEALHLEEVFPLRATPRHSSDQQSVCKSPPLSSIALLPRQSMIRNNLRLLSGTIIDTIQQVFNNGGNVGGSVGIIDGAESYFLNVGRGDTLHQDVPDEESIYLISSMTKPFLGVAIAMLVNHKENEISFDTSIKEIFPDLEGRTSLRHEVGNKELTIAHLLAHRSDFIKTTNLWECPDGNVPWQTIDLILSLFQHLPRHEKYQQPGCFNQARNYSNECFALLAELIERVSGTSWGEFVTKNVLEPLDLTQTFNGVTEA
ncbi:beta-lactamase/transpeptidase-like protein [Podospora fimiseda]|uniref:Beta-lactamase/transpeptidase-like protein n=1 Tax=Podospora fimiseda TaxID=252190 RepID=A0AAN7BSB2_9PEZI|nr:beta-lactamase/transpeptidase-like protein [Podospora fimiseda]